MVENDRNGIFMFVISQQFVEILFFSKTETIRNYSEVLWRNFLRYSKGRIAFCRNNILFKPTIDLWLLSENRKGKHLFEHFEGKGRRIANVKFTWTCPLPFDTKACAEINLIIINKRPKSGASKFLISEKSMINSGNTMSKWLIIQ